MQTLNQINFNELYQNHLHACDHYNIPPSKWDAKAEKMAMNLVEKESHYRTELLKIINIQPDETVLDIGCGPGTIALPLAKQCRQVHALDYSQGMLKVLENYQQKWGITNIRPWLKSWNDDWQYVPKADVIVASRSTLVDNLDDMISKLQQKARKRVILTSVTQPHFLDDGIFTAIERQSIGFPTYIYLVNALYQRGIQANVNFINSHANAFAFESYEELLKSVEFSLGELTEVEKQKLKAFYEQRKTQNSPITHGQNKWAVLSWLV